MQPTPVHHVVGVEVVDPGHGADEGHERLRAQLLPERLEARAPVLDVRVAELPLVQVEVVGPGGLGDGLELVVDRLQRVGVQHVVEGDVRVRIGPGVALPQLGKPFLEGGEIDEWLQGGAVVRHERPTLTYGP